MIVRVGGFSRNLRNEVTSKAKYYFLDNGVRNAVISQYNGLDARNDVGTLWENFLVSERVKMRSYTGIYGSYYFWRTYAGQEIDYLEEHDGTLFGFEFKWSDNRHVKPPRSWVEAYPEAVWQKITRESYPAFVIPPESSR